GCLGGGEVGAEAAVVGVESREPGLPPPQDVAKAGAAVIDHDQRFAGVGSLLWLAAGHLRHPWSMSARSSSGPAEMAGGSMGLDRRMRRRPSRESSPAHGSAGSSSLLP